jgi:hypothetical protein
MLDSPAHSLDVLISYVAKVAHLTCVLMKMNGILLHAALPFATLVCSKCYHSFATFQDFTD